MPKWRHNHSRARMSGSSTGHSPGLGSGSSLAACRIAHYFMLCRMDGDSRLEPNKLVGKAGLRQLRGSLIPADHAKSLFVNYEYNFNHLPKKCYITDIRRHVT